MVVATFYLMALDLLGYPVPLQRCLEAPVPMGRLLEGEWTQIHSNPGLRWLLPLDQRPHRLL